MIALYLILAVVGAVGTWTFNILSFGEVDYLAGWFANPASSSAAVDVIVVAIVCCIFFIAEGRRLGTRHVWVLIPLTFVVAIAFTLPLFLALRERRLRTLHSE